VPKPVPAAIAALLVCALCNTAAADVQVVAVTPGSSADVAIDGAAPITIGVGETIDGVTVVSADRRGAVVRVRGVAQTVPLSSYRGSVGDAVAETVTLSADSRGHFMTKALVNGTPISFMVDTGATYVAISSEYARRAGIDYRRGKPVWTSTVTGPARGWVVTIATLRVGNSTEYDVPAVVHETLDVGGLLGMSYLNRFDMQRRGATLVLRRR
jgi:aspartyl protease family protein